MKKEKIQAERVVFRKTKDGEIIALFPEDTTYADGTMCYAHIGQHFSANYAYMILHTVPATPAEYSDLLRELVTHFDYVLRVVKRARTIVRRYHL